MTDIEREKLLNDTELFLLKGKSNCSKTPKRANFYAIASVAVRRDRTEKVKLIIEDPKIGRCSCGQLIKFPEDKNVIYCQDCGQRLSYAYGYTYRNYWIDDMKEDLKR